MNDTDLFARLDFLNWRDAQLEEISLQLESDFPNLLAQIDEKIEEASTLDLAWSEIKLGKEVAEICKAWSEDHAVRALQRTETSLEAFRTQLALEFSLDPGLNQRLGAVLPALASAGLAAASVAAVPTVISFATVSTSALAIFGVSYVSWPLLAVGAAALSITAFTSRRLFGWAVENWRAKLRTRAHTKAEEAVFGLGLPEGCRTILDDIQALAIKAAANSLGNPS